MTIASRSAQLPADWPRLQNLLASAQRSHPQAGYYLHLGDLSWRICRTPHSRIQLWENEKGDLLGFALSYPLGIGIAVDIQVMPSLRGTDSLEPQVLAWAVRSLGTARHGGSSALLITSALETDTDRAQLLGQWGFRRSRDSSVHLHRNVGPIGSAPTLPPGYVIRPMATHEWPPRITLQAQVHSSGFSGDEYSRLREAPGYIPELDLTAVAPDGTLAAFCICWLDATNCTALIEPLGVHPRFRRLGLGRAMVGAALQRAGALGARNFRACTASGNLPARRLYEAMGFIVASVEVDYVRQCAG